MKILVKTSIAALMLTTTLVSFPLSSIAATYSPDLDNGAVHDSDHGNGYAENEGGHEGHGNEGEGHGGEGEGHGGEGEGHGGEGEGHGGEGEGHGGEGEGHGGDD